MKEYGFWVYTGPQTGGCEGYGEPQWRTLLDDMAAGGMNSLVICIACKRKGYRSRLPFLQHDQDPTNTVIASDNGLVHFAIAEAHRRGIRVWLQTCANSYLMAGFDLALPEGARMPSHGAYKFDLDTPGIAERCVQQCEEIAELFPEMDGFCLELEGHNILYRHRIAPYNAWARAHERPTFEEILARPPNPRNYPWIDFRAYTTWQTCELLNQVKGAMAAKGFRGDLSSICGGHLQPGAYVTEVDYNLFWKIAPDWWVVPYEYDRWRGRLAGAEYCLRYPRSMGLTVGYLARGVMTWGMNEPGWMPMPLEEHWRLDFADALAFDPDALWMFEADCFTSGPHTDRVGLKKKGFADGATARRKLLAIGREAGMPQALRAAPAPAS